MTPSRPALRAWHISAAATALWLVIMLAGSHWSRAVDHWESAATMLFGSFLAGSSPEGGGAVAFPVFTKGLHVSGAVARTFGLSIQAIGMTVAAGAILDSRRPIHVRAAVIGSIAGIAGFLAGMVVLTDHDVVFWPSTVPTPWVKATFSIVLATTSLMMVRHLRHGDSPHPPTDWTRRHDVGLVLAALCGGVLATMTGTGTNIVLFLFLVLLADISPKNALPTVVVIMAAVSVVGMVLLGVVDGQLSVAVTGDRVVEVGASSVDLRADRNDLFGLWFAAVPVVVWGAPLGSLVASRVRETQLVAFVALLAGVEVLTTVLLVQELRSEGPLIAYLVGGLVVLPTALLTLRANRYRIFAATPLD